MDTPKYPEKNCPVKNFKNSKKKKKYLTDVKSEIPMPHSRHLQSSPTLHTFEPLATQHCAALTVVH